MPVNDDVVSRSLSLIVGSNRRGIQIYNQLGWIVDDAEDAMSGLNRGRDAQRLVRRVSREFATGLQQEMEQFGQRRVDTMAHDFSRLIGKDLRVPKVRDVQGVLGKSPEKWMERTAANAVMRARSLMKADRDPAEAFAQMRAQMKTNARSAANATHNAAVLGIAKLNSDEISGVVAVAVLDNRTSSICRTRNGGMWDVKTKLALPGSAVSEDFPGRPPWHHNCRTTLSPLVRDEDDPDIEEAEEWLQSDAAEEAFGTELIQSYRKGNITLAQLNNLEGKFAGLNVVDTDVDDAAIVGARRKFYENVKRGSKKTLLLERTLNSKGSKALLLDGDGTPVAGMSYIETDDEFRVSNMGNLSKKPYAKRLAKLVQDRANETGKSAVLIEPDNVPAGVRKLLNVRKTPAGRTIVVPKRPKPAKKPQHLVPSKVLKDAVLATRIQVSRSHSGVTTEVAEREMRKALSKLPVEAQKKLAERGVTLTAADHETFEKSYKQINPWGGDADGVNGFYSMENNTLHVRMEYEPGHRRRKGPIPSKELTQTTIHEIGHAVDYNYGGGKSNLARGMTKFSSSPQFKAALEADRARPEWRDEEDALAVDFMSDQFENETQYERMHRHWVNYSQSNDTETYAEVFAYVAGSRYDGEVGRRVAASYDRMYPNTSDAIRKAFDEWMES